MVALSPLVMLTQHISLRRCSMNVSLNGWVNTEIHPGAYHDRLKCWLDIDAGGGVIPFDSCPSQIKRLFQTGFPTMANLMRCWVCESTWGPQVSEGLLVSLGHTPHSCFPVSWTLGGIAGELWQFLITNKLLCISQQCLEAPRGIGGPAVLTH